jgi:NAD(P)-dependent dehydrogenase (short-subunit alcohol dehydrogenase family)
VSGTTGDELRGRAVVVTGSGRGLGRAYALDAAAAGAAVVVNDVDAAEAQEVVETIRSHGGRAAVATASVTDAAAAAEVVATCIREFGRIDGLVNNAGILTEAPAWESTAAQSRAMVEVNVLGSIFCGHAAIRRMRDQGTGGSIVNVTSGTHLGQAGLAVYGATKGAVASLTYGWALDLDGTGIRVNAISPLAVTRMKLPPHDGHAHPEDVAAVVRFLLSDLSAGITGQIVRRARSELGLVRHPSIGTMLTGTWTLDRIADAFDTTLAEELEPIGFGERVIRQRRGTSRARLGCPARTAGKRSR